MVWFKSQVPSLALCREDNQSSFKQILCVLKAVQLHLTLRSLWGNSPMHCAEQAYAHLPGYWKKAYRNQHIPRWQHTMCLQVSSNGFFHPVPLQDFIHFFVPYLNETKRLFKLLDLRETKRNPTLKCQQDFGQDFTQNGKMKFRLWS